MKNKNFTLSLTVAFILLLNSLLQAQNINNVNYQFTKTTGNYTNLSNATSIADGATVAIGFPFYHYGVSYSNISVSIDGNTDLLSANSNFYSDLSPYLTFMDIDPNFTDSGLRHKTSGTAGSRVFVIEWRNLAIDFPGTANNNDYTNVQMAFFEGTNIIEFRYGPSVVTDLNGDFQGESGPQIYHDIIDYTTLGTRRYLLYGNPASPTGWIDLFDGDHMTGVPANGTIYRFTPSGSTAVVEPSVSANINLFPNPATSQLFIQTNSTAIEQINIYSTSSSLVMQVNPTTNYTILNTENLLAGVYVAEVKTKEGSVKKRWIKM